MLQVTGWGFKRITEGPELHSYSHPLFVRGRPDLVKQMRRPQKRDDGNFVNLVGRFIQPRIPVAATASVTYPPNDCISPLSDVDKLASTSTLSTRRGTQYDDRKRNSMGLVPGNREESSCSLLSFEDSPRSFGQAGAMAATGKVGYDVSLSQGIGYLSGDESDEDFRKLFASNDKFLGPALRSLQGMTAGSASTSPLRAVSEESSYETGSPSLPPPPTFPDSPRQSSITRTESRLAPSNGKWDAA
jgi:hypothetical protein